LIRSLNRRFLRHDSSTDVLAFPLGDQDVLEGEIYVNLDRARNQAARYRVSFAEELARLIIHGTLHLAGYDDSGTSAARRMKRIEDQYVNHWFTRNGEKDERAHR
jgi:rRNA maturation RNase YbeY